MREKLNENPLAQVALIGVLLVLAAVFFLHGSRAAAKKKPSEAPRPATPRRPRPAPKGRWRASRSGTVSATGLPPVPAATSPPPAAVIAAPGEAGDTVVLLFVHDGGIDDRLVGRPARGLAALPGVATFVVPARKIARYAAITEGVGVDRVPALVVIRPKHLARSTRPPRSATASRAPRASSRP